MMIGPVFIPSSSSRDDEPARCPHCGKELPEDEFSGWEFLGALAILSVMIWAVITIITWATTDGTLVELLVKQGHFIRELFNRVY